MSHAEKCPSAAEERAGTRANATPKANARTTVPPRTHTRSRALMVDVDIGIFHRENLQSTFGCHLGGRGMDTSLPSVPILPNSFTQRPNGEDVQNECERHH